MRPRIKGIQTVGTPFASIMSNISLPENRRGNGIAGLLGSDVLSQFGSITIDFSGGQLIIPTSSTSGGMLNILPFS